MNFIPIDLDEHKEIIMNFRKDSFRISFENTSDFNEDEYINWIIQKLEIYPSGFVLVEDDDEYIGQLELTTKEYGGERIGYVNLYYLTESYRGRGYGNLIHNYAKRYFRQQNLNEFHLRVAPTNQRAIAFYEKIGLIKFTEEHGGKVIRMRGLI